jgi:XTP/dITP diphosphohydrolase
MSEKKALVFATQNENKAIEIQGLLPDDYMIQTLADIGCMEDIPEEQPTLKGNALQKARYVYEKYGVNCFADDTGLEVDALKGAPGVLSARYAGPAKDSQENIELLLKNLQGSRERKASFRTVIALIINGNEYAFEGQVEGEIAEDRRGKEGFGYDPIFLPEGNSRSFAQMSLEEKNGMSHRSRAIAKLAAFLSKYNG